MRTLAWESPGTLGDCHTSDIGHWFAMTAFCFLLTEQLTQAAQHIAQIIQAQLCLNGIHQGL